MVSLNKYIISFIAKQCFSFKLDLWNQNQLRRLRTNDNDSSDLTDSSLHCHGNRALLVVTLTSVGMAVRAASASSGVSWIVFWSCGHRKMTIYGKLVQIIIVNYCSARRYSMDYFLWCLWVSVNFWNFQVHGYGQQQIFVKTKILWMLWDVLSIIINIIVMCSCSGLFNF